MADRSELLESIERHLQEQQAELAAFRLVWLAFVTRLLGSTRDFAEERLRDLKETTLTMLGNTKFPAPAPELSEPAKRQTQDRLKALFHDLELALSEARTMRNESGRH